MSDFINQPLLTYIGNKRKLLEPIATVVTEVAQKLRKERLIIVDACAGSGVVARRLLPLAEKLYLNDLEYYSYLMARCFFEPPTTEQQAILSHHFTTMQKLAVEGPYVSGLITQHYAPQDTKNVKVNERCFYTHENALIIDTLRDYITQAVPLELHHYCLAPLLIKASIHANTSGLFKGFHKKDGIGCFGGKGGDALGRILKPITVDLPIWSKEEVPVECSQLDVLALVETLPADIDIMFIDPPYVLAPYGSNYFMLNIIARNQVAATVSKVSGIPTDWQRSDFNYRPKAIIAMRTLLAQGLQKSKYLLISYSNEGLITATDWQELLAPYQYEKREILYEAYKGARNRKERANNVIEFLYLISLK